MTVKVLAVTDRPYRWRAPCSPSPEKIRPATAGLRMDERKIGAEQKQRDEWTAGLQTKSRYAQNTQTKISTDGRTCFPYEVKIVSTANSQNLRSCSQVINILLILDTIVVCYI
jgi:hypothetical protein